MKRQLVARVVRVKRTGISWILILETGERREAAAPYWIHIDAHPLGVHAFGCDRNGRVLLEYWRESLEEMLPSLAPIYDFDDLGWVEIPADVEDWVAFAFQKFAPGE